MRSLQMEQRRDPVPTALVSWAAVAIQPVEAGLRNALALGESCEGPPLLAGAIRHAVFPGGARIRPQLCLAVVRACGDPCPGLAAAAASAIELWRCASLVHDDLPCFGAAATRRGVLSVQATFGERIAVRCGDALIVLAFQAVASAAAPTPQLLGPLLLNIARSVGAPTGVVAGQAWECETRVALAADHQAKTGSLFAACTEGGAQAAGADPASWRVFGLTLGEAYQGADDVRDVVATSQALGKPAGRDHGLQRPSSASELGLGGAIHCFDRLVERAIDAISDCDGAKVLQALVRAESERLMPQHSARGLALAA
jgi:geranylgeranyl diphosphate synthase type II